MDKMRECIEHAELAGFVIPQAISRAEMGAAYASLGDLERGMGLADEGLAIARERNDAGHPAREGGPGRDPVSRGTARRGGGRDRRSVLDRLPGLLHFAAAANAKILKGRLAAVRGDHARAVELADEVLEWLRPLGVRPYTRPRSC